MFELLTDKLTGIFSKLKDRSRITDDDLDAVMREVRVALLEADVNFQTVRSFIQTVRAKAADVITLESLTPGQNVIRIVQEELTSILGSSEEGIANSNGLASPIILVGLQGSGKTTTTAKLALHFQHQKQSVNLVACDLRRPAAADQLETLGNQIDVPVYKNALASTPTEVALEGIEEGRKQGTQYTLIDTAGRLQIDDDLMTELEDLVAAVNPIETLLVIDSMTGQEALSVATEIHSRVPLSGLILTKMDGDARGGAALSIRHMSGIPIKFLGTGEQLNMLDVFHPDRIANRILGMGEEPWRVNTVGFPAIDLISQKNFATPKEIEEKLQIDTTKPIVLFTQHSVTTEFNLAREKIKQYLSALQELYEKKGYEVIVK